MKHSSSRRSAIVAVYAGLVLCLMVVAVSAAGAQVDEPLESPRATVSQVVGLEPITITYFSPGVKERKIWGELVPYGQNWRAGANGKTTFTFEDAVLIEGTRLEAGTYGFYVFPASDDEWQLVLNSNSEGSPNEFQADDDVVRVTVQPQDAPFRERLSYSVENFSDWPPFEADLVLHWEKKKVSMRVRIASEETEAPQTTPPPR